MAEIVGEQELNTQPQSTTPSTTNNVETIGRRTLFGTASSPEPESFRNRIIENMKTISIDTKELFDLRQLNTSFYKNFCPIYLKQLHKTLHISRRQPSESADVVKKIPKEIAYIYHKMKIDDWAFLTGGAEEDRVMRSLQNIMPHIRKLDIFANAIHDHDEDRNYEKLIPFLKYFSFNGMFPRLEILEIRHFEANNYFQSFGNLFNTIPERVRINLNFQGLEMFDEVINTINATERSNIFVTTENTEYYSSSGLENLIINFDPIQEWIQTGKLKCDYLTLHLCDIVDSNPNFDLRPIIELMKFTKLMIYGYDNELDLDYPDVLSMPGQWKQQIDTLYLLDYSYPLLGLQQFGNLKCLHIVISRNPNGAQLWFPNPNPMAAREQLRNVFGGLTLVEVSIEISQSEWNKVRRILRKEQLIECIGPLVGNFELDIVSDPDDSD